MPTLKRWDAAFSFWTAINSLCCFSDRRLRLMEEEGIIFKTGIEIGVNMTAQSLIDSHDAVLLACGSTWPRDLPIPGMWSSHPLSDRQATARFFHSTPSSFLALNGVNISKYYIKHKQKWLFHALLRSSFMLANNQIFFQTYAATIEE